MPASSRATLAPCPTASAPAPEPEALALKALTTRRRQLTKLNCHRETRLARHRRGGRSQPSPGDRGARGSLRRGEAPSRGHDRSRSGTRPQAGEPRLHPRHRRSHRRGDPLRHARTRDALQEGRRQPRRHGAASGYQSGPLPGRNAIAAGRPCLRTAFYTAWWRRAATRGSRPPIAPCARPESLLRSPSWPPDGHLVIIDHAHIREGLFSATAARPKYGCHTANNTPSLNQPLGRLIRPPDTGNLTPVVEGPDVGSPRSTLTAR